MRREIVLLLLVLVWAFLTMRIVCAEDVPEGAQVVYRGPQDSAHDYIYFRAPDGYYWRWLVRKSNGGKVNETKYTSLATFRPLLLAINDYAGIMNNALWKVDTDGDGFSDMLEYLTNGDPHFSTVIPTEAATLTFDGGVTVVPLAAVPDIGGDASNGGEINIDMSEIVSLLTQIENHLRLVLVLGAFGMGLVLWRLVILSKSQRNLF